MGKMQFKVGDRVEFKISGLKMRGTVIDPTIRTWSTTKPESRIKVQFDGNSHVNEPMVEHLRLLSKLEQIL